MTISGQKRVFDHVKMTGTKVSFLLFCQSDLMFQKFQAAFKGLRQEIVFRVNEITFTGFDDPVDRSVGQTESGIRFLLLKEKNITVIGVELGKQREIVFDILDRMERILRQQDRELRLDPDGGGKRLFVELETFRHQRSISHRGKGIVKDLLVC